MANEKYRMVLYRLFSIEAILQLTFGFWSLAFFVHFQKLPIAFDQSGPTNAIALVHSTPGVFSCPVACYAA
jgi:hypothetical protein